MAPKESTQDHGPDRIEAQTGTWLGERLRRIALATSAALIVARAYWPSEVASEIASGEGLGWSFALLIVAALAVLSWFVSGATRLRFSWTDAAVLGMMLLIGLSASHALEHRLAINLAWQWGGVGIAYVLLRQLPRTRAESSALVGVLLATAVAVSTYGLYQVFVEMPELRKQYLEDPVPMLIQAGVDPDPDSPTRQQFEDRFLYSSEPFSTFALANSLAGFIVGPLVLMLAIGLNNLRKLPGEAQGSKSPVAWPLVIALFPCLIVLTCLLLTKSRSAWAGLVVGALILAWQWRGRFKARTLALAGLGVVVVLAAMVGGLLALGWLDKEVLTQTTLSLRYRYEYWQGSWNLIRSSEPTASGERRPVWWWGLGPGNFRGPYLRHKLVESSEEIADPHNLFLEVWATGGLLAVMSMVLALGFGLWNLFGPSKSAKESSDFRDPPPAPSGRHAGPGDAPRRSGWLVGWAGLIGWLAVVELPRPRWMEILLWPQLDLIRDDADLARWLVLGFGWLLAVAFGALLWNRRPLPASGLGAGVVAVLINLLAAGGIGYAPVALMLWGLLALGLNLRDDRPCGAWRVETNRWWAFLPALVLAALFGTFAGAIVPFWQSRAAMLEADDQTARGVRSLDDFQSIADSIARAAEADTYSASPWQALAELEYLAWQARRAPIHDPVWNRIEHNLAQARKSPRNPYSLEIQRRRIQYAERLLQDPGLPDSVARQLRRIVVDATGKAAVTLNPTSANLRAQLAEALAELDYFEGAAIAAKVALKLDSQTPHLDKKLPDVVRQRLEKAIPYWEQSKAVEPEDEGS